MEEQITPNNLKWKQCWKQTLETIKEKRKSWWWMSSGWNKEKEKEAKAAICFLISYNHELNKEELWKEWIEPNKDIINVYVHYTDASKVKSEWIRDRMMPMNKTAPTSYISVVPGYIASMRYAMEMDERNEWFCMCTEACVPIISPKVFRSRLKAWNHNSVIRCREAWWNVNYHTRANLKELPSSLHLANDPWFVLTRKHVIQVMNYVLMQAPTYKRILAGGVANESVFAIALYSQGALGKEGFINASSTISDWVRKSSPMSPHVFNEEKVVEKDREVVKELLENNKYGMFMRKVGKECDETWLKTIQKESEERMNADPWRESRLERKKAKEEGEKHKRAREWKCIKEEIWRWSPVIAGVIAGVILSMSKYWW